MTISHIYKEIKDTMKMLENIDYCSQLSRSVNRLNQQKVNKAYRKLDNITAELEREYIKNKQRGGTNE